MPMATDRGHGTFDGGGLLTKAADDGGSDRPATDHQRVRVWFGHQVIADYRATCDLAQRYAAAMRRRFAGLRITIDPVASDPDRPDTPLPDERWWDMVPK